MRIPTRFARPAVVAGLAAAALAVTPAVASAERNDNCVRHGINLANHLMDDALYAASVGDWTRYWIYVEAYGNVMEAVGDC